MEKWDEFRFINFFQAIKIIKNNRKLFQSPIVLDHYTDKKKMLKKVVRKARIENNHFGLLVLNKDFFIDSIKKILKLNHIYII